MALEIEFWRRSAGISTTQVITKERLEIIGLQTPILEEIQKRQLYTVP